MGQVTDSTSVTSRVPTFPDYNRNVPVFVYDVVRLISFNVSTTIAIHGRFRLERHMLVEKAVT